MSFHVWAPRRIATYGRSGNTVDAWLASRGWSGSVAGADFEQQKFWLPTLAVGDIAGASVAQLVPRWATESEWLGQYVATGTTSRTYLDSAGVLKNDLAANALRYTYDGGRRWLALENALTNKVTCAKYNPSATTGFVKGGDAAATLTVVNDAAKLAEAGLSGLCTNGNVYKLDNSSGSTGAYVYSGTGGNSNTHAFCAYARKENVNNAFIEGTGSYAQTSGSSTVPSSAYTLVTSIGTATGAYALNIRAVAGAVVYFILPGLYEQSFAPLYPIAGTATAAEVRPIETWRNPTLAEALAQRTAGRILLRGKNLLGASTARVLGFNTTDAILAASSTTAVANKTANLTATAGSGNWSGQWAIQAGWDGTGRALTFNGGTTATDANTFGDKSQGYISRDQANTSYGNALINAIVFFPDRGDAAGPTITAPGF